MEAPIGHPTAHSCLLFRTRGPSLRHQRHRIQIPVHALCSAQLLGVVQLGPGLDDAPRVALVGDFLRAPPQCAFHARMKCITCREPQGSGHGQMPHLHHILDVLGSELSLHLCLGVVNILLLRWKGALMHALESSRSLPPLLADAHRGWDRDQGAGDRHLHGWTTCRVSNAPPCCPCCTVGFSLFVHTRFAHFALAFWPE